MLPIGKALVNIWSTFVVVDLYMYILKYLLLKKACVVCDIFRLLNRQLKFVKMHSWHGMLISIILIFNK